MTYQRLHFSLARGIPWRGLGAMALVLNAAACASAMSQPQAAAEQSGYASSRAGVVRSGSGECVRTGYWTPEMATAECDPALVAKTPEAPPAPAAEPQPPAAETQPDTSTELVIAPSEPPDRTIYIGADAFFEFDSTELMPKSRLALDRIAEQVQSAREATITIVGHADQIGPTAYNDDLSWRRAQAVRDYLTERGVPLAAITISAVGEGDPVVQCREVRGADLIDCLQPNRRTEIEVSAIAPAEAQ
ncbi:MAG TPA: OmpA family protein [Burkholderiales bacterium]